MTVARLLLLAAVTAAALAALPPAQAQMPPPGLAHGCVVVFDFPDAGETICYDVARTDCKVWEVRTTFTGTETTCLVGAQQNAAPASPPGCYEVYSRTDVGTYSVVRRNSCAPPEAYECPYPGAPIDQCQSLLQAKSASPGLPTLQRECVHQGQGELQSEDCVDPTSTSCTLYEQRTTGVGGDWWCYPSMQHGSWD